MKRWAIVFLLFLLFLMLFGCAGNEQPAFDFGNANLNVGITYGENGVIQSVPFRLTSLDGEETVLCDVPNCPHTYEAGCKAWIDTNPHLVTIAGGRLWYLTNPENEPTTLAVVKSDISGDNRETVALIPDADNAIFGKQIGNLFAFSAGQNYTLDENGLIERLEEPFAFLCIVDTETGKVIQGERKSGVDYVMSVLGTDGRSVEYSTGYMTREVTPEEWQEATEASDLGDNSKHEALQKLVVREYYSFDIETETVTQLIMSEYQRQSDELYTYLSESGSSYATSGYINGTDMIILSDPAKDYADGYLTLEELKNGVPLSTFICINEG